MVDRLETFTRVWALGQYVLNSSMFRYYYLTGEPARCSTRIHCEHIIQYSVSKPSNKHPMESQDEHPMFHARQRVRK